MQIKYIGTKEHGHTTFTKLTGIVWFPGDVHPVKDEHAKVLLRHPDAFEAVPEKAAPAAAVGGGQALGAGTTVVTNPSSSTDAVKPATKRAPRKTAAAPAKKPAAKKRAARKG